MLLASPWGSNNAAAEAVCWGPLLFVGHLRVWLLASLLLVSISAALIAFLTISGLCDRMDTRRAPSSMWAGIDAKSISILMSFAGFIPTSQSPANHS